MSNQTTKKEEMKGLSKCCDATMVRLFPTGIEVCNECQQTFEPKEEEVFGYCTKHKTYSVPVGGKCVNCICSSPKEEKKEVIANTFKTIMSPNFIKEIAERKPPQETLREEFGKEWQTGNLEFTYGEDDYDRADIEKICNWWLSSRTSEYEELIKEIEGLRKEKPQLTAENLDARLLVTCFNEGIGEALSILKEKMKC